MIQLLPFNFRLIVDIGGIDCSQGNYSTPFGGENFISLNLGVFLFYYVS